ncbi:MAG TPA: hypothetical protein HPP94_15925 [Desulfuromonadales bacterium]|nr:hypothetical protein [Desulfuromonadales bacterium]
MFGNSSDLGASLFKTWTEKQRSDEIEKLVQGFRNGVTIGILLKMAETVAGDTKKAKKYLKKYMTIAERTAAIESADAALVPMAKLLLS